MTLSEFLDHLSTTAKHALDLFSVTVAVGAIVNLLPPLAAGFTILWTGLQIYGWFETRRIRHEAVREAALAGLAELEKSPKA